MAEKRTDLIRKLIREALNKSNIGFIAGKCYNYNELSDEIQSDIDIQFKMFDEDPENAIDKFDGFPEDYSYCFKYLNPNEIKQYFPYIKYITSDRLTYIKNIIADIETNGLKNPPVGSEGNHRAAAFLMMNKAMPYLEIIGKKHIKY